MNFLARCFAALAPKPTTTLTAASDPTETTVRVECNRGHEAAAELRRLAICWYPAGSDSRVRLEDLAAGLERYDRERRHMLEELKQGRMIIAKQGTLLEEVRQELLTTLKLYPGNGGQE